MRMQGCTVFIPHLFAIIDEITPQVLLKCVVFLLISVISCYFLLFLVISLNFASLTCLNSAG